MTNDIQPKEESTKIIPSYTTTHKTSYEKQNLDFMQYSVVAVD